MQRARETCSTFQAGRCSKEANTRLIRKLAVREEGKDGWLRWKNKMGRILGLPWIAVVSRFLSVFQRVLDLFKHSGATCPVHSPLQLTLAFVLTLPLHPLSLALARRLHGEACASP